MNDSYPHEDNDFFKVAIEAGKSKTDFDALLIEKDYYCSLILRKLFLQTEHEIIFKGGTLLNKVHVSMTTQFDGHLFTIIEGCY